MRDINPTIDALMVVIATRFPERTVEDKHEAILALTHVLVSVIQIETIMTLDNSIGVIAEVWNALKDRKPDIQFLHDGSKIDEYKGSA